MVERLPNFQCGKMRCGRITRYFFEIYVCIYIYTHINYMKSRLPSSPGASPGIFFRLLILPCGRFRCHLCR